jgi:two-component system, response regulator
MHNKLILLVEDNPDDEELTLMALRRNEIHNEVHVARDGAEALEFLFGEPGNKDPIAERPLPALILLDLKLPKVDGLDVLQEIRSHHRTRFVPVVILTSSREDQDLIRGYSLRCNSYVRKPVGFSDFVEATRQLGTYWLGLNEAPPSFDASAPA